MTGISATLKSWYVCLLSACVTFGTCVDLHVRLDGDEKDDTAFGIAIGVVSTAVALFWILVHYDFISQCEEGGWLELSSSFFLILLWIIGLAIFTADQGIAATLTGSYCGRDPRLGPPSDDIGNCTIVIYEEDEDGAMNQYAYPCSEWAPRQVPGSNLYFAAWICFLSSLNITFRWKAAQALQFAQAQQEKQRRRLEGPQNGEEDYNSQSDNDNDEDVDGEY